jgi:hypothetical protein
MDTEAAGQAAYNLREVKGEVRYCWVIERADGSVCFRLARKEWRLAEEILYTSCTSSVATRRAAETPRSRLEARSVEQDPRCDATSIDVDVPVTSPAAVGLLACAPEVTANVAPDV